MHLRPDVSQHLDSGRSENSLGESLTGLRVEPHLVGTIDADHGVRLGDPEPVPPSDEDLGRRRDRSLVFAAAAGVLVKILTNVTTLVTTAVTARGLAPAEFGFLATILSINGILAFADLGIGNGLMMRLSTVFGQDTRAARRLVSSALLMLTVSGAFLTIASVLVIRFAPWEGPLHAAHIPGAATALLIFAISRTVAVPLTLGQRIHFAVQQGGRANLWVFLGGLAVTVSTLAAGWMHATVWVFVACNALPAVVISGLECLSIFTVEHRALRPRLADAHAPTATSLARVGLVFLLLSIVGAISYQTDTVIVNSVLGPASAATFAVGLRMFSAVMTLLGSAAGQLWTAMSEALSRGDLAWVRSRFVKVVIGTALITGVLNAFLLVFGQTIALRWVGREYVPGPALLVGLAIWGTYWSIMAPVSFLLNAAQIIRSQLLFNSLMAAGNLGLSLYLTKSHGIVGPIWGSLVSHVLLLGIPSLIIARRILAGRAGICRCSASGSVDHD